MKTPGALSFTFSPCYPLSVRRKGRLLVMQEFRSRLGLAVLLAMSVLSSCAADPPPIVIHEEKPLSVSLQFDPSNGTGHSHPASLSHEQMMAVLRGLGVRSRDTMTGFNVFSSKDSSPAFTTPEASTLAPYLRQALAKASPKDMATFYAVTRDLNKGEVVTSGGMFLRGRYLYVILANARTSPYSNQYENAHTVDTRDRPLIPIARYRFTTTFTPESAWIPNKRVRGQDGYDRYLDESKLVVIDLDQLPELPTPVQPLTPKS